MLGVNVSCMTSDEIVTESLFLHELGKFKIFRDLFDCNRVNVT